MVWRLTASKGTSKITSGSSRKDILVKKAAKLKENGYRTRVYKVR